MKRFAVLSGLIALLGMIPGVAHADPPAAGGVEGVRLYDADAFELPEGVAVDKRGRIYVSMPFIGELRRVDPGGAEHLVATLPTGGGFGPLGLAVDGPGNVYVGVVTFDPATHGVWRITPGGSMSRLPGSQAIGFPNGVAFGDRGTLYVSDTTGGAVWRVPKGGAAEPWLVDPVLAGTGLGGFGFDVGANGITYRHGTVFVTVTEQASVVSIPVAPDGSAGPAAIVAQDPALFGADGLAADVHGGLYVAVIAQSTIVRVAGDGSLTTIADGSDGLDFASSVAFGSGRGNRTTLYAVNFSIGPLFGGVRTHGPGLLGIEVGVPGLPQP